MRKGFTLLELLIVVIVIGVLATLAVPQFLSAVEKGRIAKAKNALGIIAKAEKMYRAENDVYLAVDNDGLTDADGLGDYIEMDQIAADTDWDYAVTIDTDSFVATATREGSSGYAETILTNDQDGACTSNHDLAGRECAAAEEEE
ncbi:MAG: prepilin-type N-terminal cleavage/methylation domain-containing protein [Candidatus Omnitrophica bacterium]|nr:prepilin-type N-terminal cleavage/methylation domain-containing protein [Candidatus Omnitrophota bacterium]